ncbi:hypothetical protein MalM25_36020 [Planctomycetes bacterium MalM25]|nr:hypothetical protein MalM25_36020 [Planctomycetes bacterium MalM25]
MAILPIFVAFAVVVLVVAILGGRQQKARVLALAKLAAQEGWRFRARSLGRLPRELEQIDAFNRGSSRQAYNTLSGRLTPGERPLIFHAGDYRYQTQSGSGKNRRTQTHRLSYLAVRLEIGPTPRVAIRREHFFDSIAAAIGFDDIDFESAEFSREFHVSSDDKRFAYDLIHPRAIEMLLASSPERLELRNGWLVVTNGERVWEPHQFVSWFKWAERFLALWPSHMNHQPGAAGRRD